jgi:hypothetical protein
LVEIGGKMTAKTQEKDVKLELRGQQSAAVKMMVVEQATARVRQKFRKGVKDVKEQAASDHGKKKKKDSPKKGKGSGKKSSEKKKSAQKKKKGGKPSEEEEFHTPVSRKSKGKTAKSSGKKSSGKKAKRKEEDSSEEDSEDNTELVEKVVEALDGLEPEIFGEVVAQTEATALRYQQYRDEWIRAMEDREFRSGGSTAKKVADELAGWMVMSVLDFVAEKEQGRGWGRRFWTTLERQKLTGWSEKRSAGLPRKCWKGRVGSLTRALPFTRARKWKDARPKSRSDCCSIDLTRRCPKSCRRCRS